jgi:hypothetical protein
VADHENRFMNVRTLFSNLFHRRPVSSARPAAAASTAPLSTASHAATASTARDTFEPGKPMTVNLGKVTGTRTAAEKKKVADAATLMKKVLNSREFRESVLSARYAGKPGFASDTRSPAQIYKAIREGKENFAPKADGEVDLNLRVASLGPGYGSTVGYTTTRSDTVTTNRKFFAKMSPATLAGHLGHEWLHKIGFHHDKARTARRPESVPYEIGQVIARLAKSPSALHPL